MTSRGDQADEFGNPGWWKWVDKQDGGANGSRALESTSGSSSLKAIVRTEVYKESRVVSCLTRALPSGTVQLGESMIISSRCSGRWVLLSRNLTVATA